MPPSPADSNRAVSLWLFFLAGAIFLMVVIGGITRLTESGLSIVEWNLVGGTLPPFGQEAWTEMFSKYQTTPQFRIVNHQMTLAEFKNIFWWEYIHRLWGRALGFFFIIPFLWFACRRLLSRALLGKLLIALVLGGSQGLLGWYMVKSGLVDVPRVSGYRLTAHLLLATALMGYVLWLALDLRPKADGKQQGSWPFFLGSCAVTFMIFLQVGLGGLMAGTKAGLIYPSFPKFNDQWLPDNLFAIEPLWRNLFENPGVIQLLHRLGAVAVTLAIFMLWLVLASEKQASSFRKILVHLLPLLVIVQFLLGVLTLMGSVGTIPLVRGVLHQATGIFLFGTAVALTHQFRPGKSS